VQDAAHFFLGNSNFISESAEWNLKHPQLVKLQ